MDILESVTDPRLRGMIELCRAEVPGFEIRFKTQSPWMKFLNVFAQLFNKKFMTEYTTTTGSTVYFPSKNKLLNDQGGYADVLAHELVHMVERKNEGLVWNFLRYAFPQILAVLALFAVGAIWNPWFLLALVFLLALAPLPAPGRRDIEFRGYTMSMAVFQWRYGLLTDTLFEETADQFTGSMYWFMWPFRADILHRLKLRGQDIRTGAVLQDSLFRRVHDIYYRAKNT